MKNEDNMICINCYTTFSGVISSDSCCPACGCIAVMPLNSQQAENATNEQKWVELDQQRIENQIKFDRLKKNIDFLSNYCGSAKIPECLNVNDSLHQVRSDINFSHTLSFDDLDENELALIAATTPYEKCQNKFNPAIITEMNERFLHTFVDCCF